ncbi:MAG: fasciclin domain-containing protein [Bacteroidales bacterium]|nr:fasciclin domain-containing protein [Bacteroidales bacterium]
MNYRTIFKILLFLPFVIQFNSCDPWKDYNQLNNSNVDKTLNEVIASDADISTFAQILKLTGYEKLLLTEQSLTVFAPSNEALQDINLENTEALTEWVKNHIAKLTYYTDKSGQFASENIELINGKNVPLGLGTVSGSNIIKNNIYCANGVLHIIDSEIIFRKNIWEYMQGETGYLQTQYILSQEDKVMDMTKSIQIGININGKPIFDTVWAYRNTFLETYQLNNERKNYTVVLIDQSSFNSLINKYSKYFAQDSLELQNREITHQITLDMVLKDTVITTAGRFPSVDDVLVDIDPSNITETYQASNGIVYKVNAADVKVFNNKIKEQIIEAEDYVLRWDDRDAWEVRYRSWASGGKDVILKGYTTNTFEYDYYNTTLEEMRHKIIDRNGISISYRSNDPVWSRTYNPYLQFEPVMYSTPYEIRWVTYDDVAAHAQIALDSTTETGVMTLEQKLFISFPGEPVLNRLTDGQVKNNFSTITIMASSAKAGVHEETQLVRYRKLDTSSPSTSNLYLLNTPYTIEDDYGKEGTLICPAYGKATFWVSNTVREKGTSSNVSSRNPGLIFLDYIRLTPLVDPND